ncbi:MAG: protein kinase domain-containing protein, partial [Caulobacterales bacterium]
MICENVLEAGAPCGFSLLNVRTSREAAQTASALIPDPKPDAEAAPPAAAQICPNGHPIEPGDRACITCGALLDAPSSALRPSIGDWLVLEELQQDSDASTLYRVEHAENGRTALLRWFGHGVEPATRTYPALQALNHPALARLIAYGRIDERSFEVWDQTAGPSLSDLIEEGGLTADAQRMIVEHMRGALEALAAANLRHGSLSPRAIRFCDDARQSLELGDLSTAALAEFELEPGSGGASRYASPEAVVGSHSPASDWWSLGIVVLEMITGGRCFADVNDRAFLLHAIARAIDIPADAPPDWQTLLKGLLTKDHSKRWRAEEVGRWLSGDRTVPVFFEGDAAASTASSQLIIAGKPVRSASAFALAAASAEAWDEAFNRVETGEVGTWLEQSGDGAAAKNLRAIMDERTIERDVRFALALLALGPQLPLVVRGDIKSPNRLLEAPKAAHVFFEGAVVDILKRLGREPWLVRLAERARRVEARAAELKLDLVRDRFEVVRLAAFEARLEAFWRER